jgi:hypothetical protein
MPGQWRAILDLKALNQFLLAPKFKMETAESIRKQLHHSEWTTSIDLVDAYLHVPIHKSFRHYLRFVVDGVAYQYRALPAGLSTAPGVFTRVIGVIKIFLHQLGIHIHQYIDDWLIRAISHLICHNHTQVSLHITQMLGFVAHYQKSQLTPLQIFIFLGYQFLLHLGIVRPTMERWEKLLKILTLFAKAKAMPARMWQRLLGLLAATERLVPQGLLHMRPLQLSLKNAWNQHTQSQGVMIPIDPLVLPTIRWWQDPANVMVGVPIKFPEPQVEIFTDASLFGWGAHLNQQTVSGVWTDEQSLLHINILELEAVRLALLHFQSQLIGLSILIATDNTTVVSYINRQGGTRSDSLYLLVENVLIWCQLHSIYIRARHIPGRLNVLADLLSRRHQVIPTEWKLHHGVFQVICRLWGTPHVDLFATYLNNQLPIYVSPMPDPLALAVDALSLDWSGMIAYAFPPAIAAK